MKKITVFLLTYTILMIIFLLFFSPQRIERISVKPIPITKEVEITKVEVKDSIIPLDNSNKDNQKFLTKLAYVESGGNYHTITGNYIGAYQIHTMCFKQFGYEINPDSFKINPDVFNKDRQDSLVTKILAYHERLLQKEIRLYHGKFLEVSLDSNTTKKIRITKSGILAAAHLGGAGSVYKLLRSNGQENFRDGNNCPISVYLEKFSELKVNF